MNKPITIVGGGLAGLTLGIGLRQLRVPVAIWEAGRYPRHRVCGEFVSGRGKDVLHRLGLMEALIESGATPARSAGFFLGNAQSPVRPVEPPALCMSRFTLDQLLADRFRDEGGDLRENSRWDDKNSGDGVVRASGRCAQPVESEWRWFGLKVHAREVELEADLEMHGIDNGYVGLCRLPGGEVNVCGLFRTRPGSSGAPVRELLRGAPGTTLHRRLASALFEETSYCSIAGLRLKPQRAREHSDCRLGDALTMIPPVTGNGMSMAFEAAEIAAEPIAAYARGEIAWKDACRAIARDCDCMFRQRLVWAKWLQQMMFTPALRGRLGAMLLNSNWLWQLVFNRTR
jgi:menaquinone-9 beta-reductase